MIRKQYYLLFGFAIFLLLVVITMALFLFFGAQAQPNPSVVPTPTSVIIPTQAPHTNPPVNYQPDKTDRMLDLVEHRKPLSTEDAAIRANLIQSLGNTSGVLQATSTYRLEYVQAPDVFQVEILTINIQAAKENVVSWLKAKGLSQDGICHLPVTFYLNYDVAQQLRGLNVTFNPLPEGC